MYYHKNDLVDQFRMALFISNIHSNGIHSRTTTHLLILQINQFRPLLRFILVPSDTWMIYSDVQAHKFCDNCQSRLTFTTPPVCYLDRVIAYESQTHFPKPIILHLFSLVPIIETKRALTPVLKYYRPTLLPFLIIYHRKLL